MSQVILAEYGRAKTVNFDLYEVDGVDFRVDAADAGADCSIMKDEGAEGTCANDFVDEGQSYSLVLTAAEMQAARATLLIVDSSTKVWLDKHIYIETYGHPSSAHPFMTPYWANGAVNDGSASSTVWTFDGFTEATADHVIGSELTFTSGANAGQCRTVTDYTSTVITVAPAFLAAPADNDEFVLKASPQTSLGQVPAVDTASILTDTAVIGALGAGLTDLGGMSTGMKGEVNTEADNSMVTYGLDHLISASVAASDVADNSIIADLVSKEVTTDYDDYVNTTDSLQAIRDKSTDIETDTAEIGTAGAGLSDLGGMSTGMKGEVNTEVDGSMVTYGVDHLVTTAVAGADVADNTIIADLVSKSVTSDYDDFVNTTDSLQAIRDKSTDIETDTQAIETDTQDIQSRLPAALSSGNIKSDILAISTDTVAADNCELFFDGTGYAGGTTKLKVDTVEWLTTAVTLSTGNKPDVNIDEISDDTTAPGNMELFYDGTGYAGGTTKLKVDTVEWLTTAVTLSTGNKPDVNIDEISDDTTAPGNLELMYDGTGYVGGTEKLNVDAVEINSNTDAAASLAKSAEMIQEFTVDNTSFTATTTAAQVDAVTPGSLSAVDDLYIGAILIIRTGTGKYERTDCTDYDGTNKRFTYTALTTAPADDATIITV